MATSPDQPSRVPQAEPDAAAADASGASRGPWLFLAFLALLGLLVLAFTVFRPLRPRDDGTTRPLTRLALQPLASDASPLGIDDLRGKVVLVNFWGTWCPPCVKEFPAIAQLQKQYHDRADFRLMAVSCGAKTDEALEMPRLRSGTRAFLDQWSLRSPDYLDVPVFVDPDRATRQAVREAVEWPTTAAGELTYPFTVLLDRQQRVRARWVGPATTEQLTAEIEKVLGE